MTPCFGQNRRMVLFVEQIIAGRNLCFLVLMTAFEMRNDLVGDVKYLSVASSVAPEMMSGVRASSMRIESTSSMIAK